MAMHRSDELPEASLLVFQQMKELGVTAIQNSIAIIKEDEGFVELSTTVHGHIEPKTFRVPINDPHVMSKAVAGWKAKRKSLKIQIQGKELKKYNDLRNSFLKTKVNFPEDNWIVNVVFFSKGWLSFSSNQEISNELFQVLERFAFVFDQTYTRFLDLQKAEAQAREAEIELGLERVRARAMAMQKSNELAELVNTVFKELTKLHFTLDRCIITIIDEKSKSARYWMANPEVTETPMSYHVPLNENSYMKATFEAWKNRKAKWVYDLKGKEKTETVDYIFNKTELRFLPEEAKKGMAGTKRIFLLNH
jgi:hypothetical protein